MKNICLFALFLSLALANTTAQNALKSDWESMQLNGKVKRIESRTYQTFMRNDSIILKSMTNFQALDFDELGFIQQTETKYPRYSSHVYLSKYFYDSQKRIIKHENYKDGALGESDSISYNKHNKVEKAWVFANGKTIRNIKYKYDKKGLLLEELDEEIDEKGKTTILKKETFAYDKQGNLIEETLFEKGTFARPNHTTTYIYDKNILQIKTRKVDNITYISSYKYSGDTTKIGTKEIKDGVLLTDELEINIKNAEGLTTHSFQADANGKQIQRETTIYNQKNEVVLREQFDENDEPIKHNYTQVKYLSDEKGNVIQRVEYLFNGNSLDATLYKITYY